MYFMSTPSAESWQQFTYVMNNSNESILLIMERCSVYVADGELSFI